MGLKKLIKSGMKPFMGVFYAMGILPKGMKYDVETQRVMQKLLKQSSNCIDIGANEGEILKDMLALAPKGEHFAFEPIPGLARKLETDFPKNCHIFNVGLSDKEGELEFNYVKTNPAYSGFRERSYDRPEEAETIKVKTARLDDLIPDDISIDLVKIDVEGAEEQVLRGGLETLRRNQPIVIFEHGLGAADVYGTRPEVIYDLFDSVGLKITTQSGWLKNKQTFSREEFARQFDQGINHYFLAFPPKGDK